MIERSLDDWKKTDYWKKVGLLIKGWIMVIWEDNCKMVGWLKKVGW